MISETKKIVQQLSEIQILKECDQRKIYRFVTLTSFHTPKIVNTNLKINRVALTMHILSYPKPSDTTA